jgi:hypothetical protein
MLKKDLLLNSSVRPTKNREANIVHNGQGLLAGLEFIAGPPGTAAD